MKGSNVWAILCLVAMAGLVSPAARAEVKAEENIVFDLVDVSETHPNARLFRQDGPGDRAGVLARAAQALQARFETL